MCSGCMNVLYCSKECQKFDWKIHKVNCEWRKNVEVFLLAEWYDYRKENSFKVIEIFSNYDKAKTNMDELTLQKK